MSVDFAYTPSEWGKRYHELTVDEALGAGAAGPGKSMVLLMDPFQQIMVEHERCMKIDHIHHIPMGMSKGWALHLRRSRPMLEQTLRRASQMFSQVDPGVKYNSQNTTFTFSSGYKYEFGHCLRPNDWELRMSNEYTWIGFDELVQFEEQQYEQISGRLRSSDPVLTKMLRVRSMSNPLMTNSGQDNISVSNPQWVRERFVDPAPEGGVVMKKAVDLDGETEYITRIYLPATLEDNPDPVFVRSYKRTLLGKSLFTQRALLYGDWYAVAGSYFGEDWNPVHHVCKPFHVPDDWKRFRSMDWGFKAPGCVHWWAMDPDGNLFCEKELTFRGMHETKVAEEIERIERTLGLWDNNKSLITGPADTQLWEERGDSGMTKAAKMSKVGVNWVKADKKSRATNGIRILNRIQDHDNWTMTPGIVFFESCRKIVQTLPAIQTNQNNAEEPMDGGEDHWLDSCMYACAFASHGRKGIPSVKKKDPWDDDRDNEKSLHTNRGRTGYGI